VSTQTGLTGSFKFVQNVLGVVNGYNGTTNGSNPPKRVGWLDQTAAGYVAQLQHGGYPILDWVAGVTDQSYNQNFVSTPSPDGTTVTITALDVPKAREPVINGVDLGPTGITEDLLFQIRTYIVWKWNQVAGNSNGAAVPVFYFLGYYNWQVNFFGNSPSYPPISVILVFHGVTADKAWTASNADPGANAMDLNRIFNNENQWVAA
jgi:hypothetical protein